jgi:UDP-N-acetylmuramyl pentapeptide phosphotransferase/UDP-N-acetylglucosamine-1-phosphate transferase
MLAVEQGIPGMLIFVALVFYSLLAAERMYHQLPNKESQYIVMSAILSLIVILSLLLINDLVETDKIGSFFFIILAILVNQELSLLKKDDVKEEVSST